MTDVQNPPGGASAGGLPDAAIAAPVVEAPGQSTGLVLVPPSAVAVPSTTVPVYTLFIASIVQTPGVAAESAL